MTTTDREISESTAEPTAMATDQLDMLIDDVLGEAETRGLELLCPNGVMEELTKRVFERELT
ncbi:MAG: hypothetical protein ACSLFB_08355 [Acidimicrobiales bacterium]